MDIKTLNGKKVKYYDSIDELPILNYQKFNKYILFSTNIGSDINSIVQHHANILRLIDIDTAKAKIELGNTMQSFMFLENSINPDLLAFACLVYSIDDNIITDYSDANLKSIIDLLKEEKFSIIKALLDTIKKKLNYELVVYYPEYFADTFKENISVKYLKQRALLSIDIALAKTDDEKSILLEKLRILDIKIIKKYKVVKLYGKDTYEIQYDKQFESSCLIIAQETSLNPHNLTVLQFYSLIENIQKQTKQKIKASKKHG